MRAKFSALAPAAIVHPNDPRPITTTQTSTIDMKNTTKYCFILYIMMSGDVHYNPGPIRYPCTKCKQPVNMGVFDVFSRVSSKTVLLFPTDVFRKNESEKDGKRSLQRWHTKCKQPVNSNQKALQCDFCDHWTHLRCTTITVKEYHILAKCDDQYFWVQAFVKKWWVESDFKAPNLPLSLRFKGSGCHCNSI
jgi:hypothetical protein